jgi:hypothetical protein
MRKILAFSIVLIVALIAVSPQELKAQEGASIYLAPSTGTFITGNTFDISIFVNTGGVDINTVKVDLKFNPQKIQIVNPTVGKSFVSVWIAQPAYSNINGTATFQGGVPSPGFNTSAGLISTITFRAIAPGDATISILEDSHILLNDGKGTDVLNSMGRGVYKIILPPPEGPKIFSPTHPDQNKWYKDNNPTFSWQKEEGITDFSYSIDNDYRGVPDNISEGGGQSVSFANLKDGFWYFHIKAKKGGIWGGTSHYVIKIDTTPPAEFTLNIEPNVASVISAYPPVISFVTTDALSGLDHYELKTIGFEGANVRESIDFFVETVSPYNVPVDAGVYKVVVRAFDKAGNWRESSEGVKIIPQDKLIIIREGINLWVIFLYWRDIGIIIVSMAVIVLFILFWRRRRIKKKNANLK